ncbi:MAG: tetratricopeptide repeat-containing protein kinase family protein [Myxococcota bacterium]
MAPEQHEGRPADAKSDQYAFCVSLWEALTGGRPFDLRDLYGAKQRMELGTDDAPRKIPRHLQAPLRRGLRPDADERFGSMEELLEHLRRDPARRRRSLAFGVVGIAGLLGWQGLQWRDQQRRDADCQAHSSAIAEVWSADARQRLRQNFESSGGAGSEFAFEQASRWIDEHARRWSEARAAVCESTPNPAGVEAESPVALECLEERRLAVAALLTELQRADDTMVRRAVRAAINLPDASLCTDAEWLRARPSLPPDAATRESVAALRQARSETTAKLAAGRVAQAMERADETLDHARTVAWSPEIAEVQLDRAEALEALGRYDEAEEAASEALTLAVGAGDDAAALRSVARLVYVVGYGRSRHDEALRIHDLGVAIARRMGLADDDPRRTALLNNVAVVHWARGAYDEARAGHEAVLAIKAAALGEDHLDLMGSFTNLGIVQATVGDIEGAQSSLTRALQIATEHLGEDHLSVATALSRLGTLENQRGRPDRALPLLDHALEVTRRILGDEHPDVGFLLHNTGHALLEDGRWDEAMQRFEQALTIERGQGASQHPALAATLGSMARVHAHYGRRDEALDLQQQALKLRVDLYGAEHPESLESAVDVAELRIELGRSSQALPLLEPALVALEQRPDVGMLALRARFALARALWDGGGDRHRAAQLVAEAKAAGMKAGASASQLERLTRWQQAHDPAEH